jgi:hypothetical protein
MSTSKHTPEPWRVDLNESLKVRMIVSSPSDAIGKAPIAQILTANPYQIPEEIQQANSARIVECVNAFAGVENPAEYIDNLKESRGAYILQDQEIRFLINADEHESTFDEVARLKNRYDELLEWKTQAQNGFRLMEEAHEILKTQYDKVVGEVQQLLILHNAEQEGLQQPGVLQWIEAVQKVEQTLQPGVVQWIQVVQKFGRALKEVEKPLTPRTTTN